MNTIRPGEMLEVQPSLTTFVVGPPEAPQIVRFVVINNDGARNIQTLDPLPPLNILGLRRLAKTLIALADLLEYATPRKAAPEHRNRP